MYRSLKTVALVLGFSFSLVSMADTKTAQEYLLVSEKYFNNPAHNAKDDKSIRMNAILLNSQLIKSSVKTKLKADCPWVKDEKIVKLFITKEGMLACPKGYLTDFPSYVIFYDKYKTNPYTVSGSNKNDIKKLNALFIRNDNMDKKTMSAIKALPCDKSSVVKLLSKDVNGKQVLFCFNGKDESLNIPTLSVVDYFLKSAKYPSDEASLPLAYYKVYLKGLKDGETVHINNKNTFLPEKIDNKHPIGILTGLNLNPAITKTCGKSKKGWPDLMVLKVDVNAEVYCKSNGKPLHFSLKELWSGQINTTK